MTPPHQIIGRASHALIPIGNALDSAATIMAEISDQLPKRGPLVDLYIELAEALAYAEHTYHDANEALLAAYQELEHAERAQQEGWTPQPLTIAER